IERVTCKADKPAADVKGNLSEVDDAVPDPARNARDPVPDVPGVVGNPAGNRRCNGVEHPTAERDACGAEPGQRRANRDELISDERAEVRNGVLAPLHRGREVALQDVACRLADVLDDPPEVVELTADTAYGARERSGVLRAQSE